ncbi:MAG: hypothetical protein A4E50_01786 [Methanosaeta sp. PtaB.Bin087]|jgi:hypothetical protein|nr:MAG: hypothetical protein A4E50_01786 [Methanosaeta sp. PtaB.Bin087]
MGAEDRNEERMDIGDVVHNAAGTFVFWIDSL